MPCIVTHTNSIRVTHEVKGVSVTKTNVFMEIIFFCESQKTHEQTVWAKYIILGASANK